MDTFYWGNSEIIGLLKLADHLLNAFQVILSLLVINLIRNRQNLPFRGTFFLLGTFLVLNGLINSIDHQTISENFPLFLLGIKVFILGMATYDFVLLCKIFPLALKIPDFLELQDINRQLNNCLLERQNAKDKLQQEKDFLSALLDQLCEGIVVCDNSGKLILFNQASQNFHGLTETDINLENWAEYYSLYQSDGQTLMAVDEIPLFRALQGEIVENAEMVIHPENEQPRIILANGQAFFNPQGEKLGAVVAMYDITAQKQAQIALEQEKSTLEKRVEERTSELQKTIEQLQIVVQEYNQIEMALRHSQTQLQLILENTPTVIYAKDNQGRFTLVNRKFETLFNCCSSQVLNQTNFDVFTPEAAQQLNLIEQQVLTEGKAVKLEEKIPCVHQYRTFLSIKFPLLGSDGTPDGLCSISTDITDRKRIEEKLRLFESAVNRANDAIVITEADPLTRPGPKIIYVNEAFTRLTGYSAEEMIGQSPRCLQGPETDRDQLAQIRASLKKLNPVQTELINYHKDGSKYWVEMSISPVTNSEQEITHFVSVQRDVTHKRLYANSLLTERKQMQQIITDAPFAVAMLDREFRYIAHSQQWLKDYHLSEESLIGLSHLNIFPNLPDYWLNIYHRAFAGEVLSCPEDKMNYPDGIEGYVRWAIHPWHINETEIGGIFIATYPIDELVKGRESALETVRLKSQFIANMSHEIRTPMNGVMGMAGLLMKSDLSPKQKDFVRAIRTSANHLLTIINDILDFSKLEANEMVLEELDFNLEECIETILDLLATQAEEKSLELAVLIEPDVCRHLCGDPSRLKQVLLNLIGNALKFTSEGEVVLQVKEIPASDDKIKLYFSVKDTGIGIPPEGHKRLFEAFSQVDASTTRQFGGTGLGLVICKQLVTLMGGEIGVESQPGQGSTFWFTVQFKPPVIREKSDLPKTLSHLKLLVVDPSATVCQSVRTFACSWGMQADEAYHPDQALVRLRSAARCRQPYDFAVFDQQLILSRGERFIEVIQNDPRLLTTKLILMTSMNQLAETEELLEWGFSSYVMKPLRASRLFDALLTALATEIACLLEERRSQPSPEESSLVSTPQFNLKILLVEDHPINQQVILNQLSLLGCEADVADNGEQALKRLESTHYDVVFMDCQMPILDGYATTQELRRRERKTPNQHTIVIALTAHALPVDRQKCLAVGMDDYISKPVEQEELETVLRHWSTQKQWVWTEVTPPQLPKSQVVVAQPPEEQPLVSENNQTEDQSLIPFDLKRLQTISRGKLEFQQKLLQLFIDNAKIDLKMIREALLIEDYETLVTCAHRLKGSSGNVGMRNFPALASNLEQKARQKTLEGCQELVNTMEAQLTEAIAFIQTHLS